ncbi:MAG: hypothetical protein HRF49_12205 [bacterium]|jgi:hypothetical protein
MDNAFGRDFDRGFDFSHSAKVSRYFILLFSFFRGLCPIPLILGGYGAGGN